MKNFINLDDYYLLVENWNNRNEKVFELDGKRIISDQDFFSEAIKKIPFSPPLSGKVNWDALCDSLFDGLYNLGNDNINIVWKNFSSNRLTFDLELFLQIFKDISEQINNESMGGICIQLFFVSSCPKTLSAEDLDGRG